MRLFLSDRELGDSGHARALLQQVLVQTGQRKMIAHLIEFVCWHVGGSHAMWVLVQDVDSACDIGIRSPVEYASLLLGLGVSSLLSLVSRIKWHKRQILLEPLVILNLHRRWLHNSAVNLLEAEERQPGVPTQRRVGRLVLVMFFLQRRIPF